MKLDLNLIANAVLNGADGIFLKTGSLNEKETVEVIKNVDAVCRQAESARWQKEIFDELNYKVYNVTVASNFIDERTKWNIIIS